MAKLCGLFVGLATWAMSVHAVGESQDDCVESTCATVDVNLLQHELKVAAESARHKRSSGADGTQNLISHAIIPTET